MAYITGTSYSDDIDGTNNSDTIEGRGGHDRIWGYGGDDLLLGGSGNDELDGGAGADEMEGGTGDDLYVVDSTLDEAVEFAGEGNDVLLTYLSSYTLSANIEDLVALDDADFTGTGNALDNFIYGYVGDDILDGGLGNDILYGHKGDDAFFIDDAGDEAVEYDGEGYDTVFTSLAALTLGDNLEELVYDGSGAFHGTGNGLSNYLEGGASGDTLKGLAGNDLIDGGAGADLLIGGTGNDTYEVDNANDKVTELTGEGDDWVLASVSYALAAGASVELLRTSNQAATTVIDLTGNELANNIEGNAGVNILMGMQGNDRLFGFGGNDRLDGGSGADRLTGGTGNDRYIVDNAGDVIVENGGEGDDRVSASISYTLAAGVSIETLTTTNDQSLNKINLTGNELANRIQGNAGANVLNGGGGNDRLFGGAGDDRLEGGSGNDELSGGAGRDDFRFASTLGANNVDRILDFSTADDVIQLDDAVFTGLATGTLSASAFHTGNAAADASDRIVYNSATGALFFDADGSGGGAAVQFATLNTGLNLTASDFLVI